MWVKSGATQRSSASIVDEATKGTENDIKKLDADQIAAKEAEDLQKKRRELQARLKSQEKKVDYFERAKRLEEIPLLQTSIKEREQQEVERIAAAIEEHKLAVTTRDRLARMKLDKDDFLAKLKKERNIVFKDKLKGFEESLAAKKKKLLDERRAARKEERRAKYLKEKEPEDAERKAVEGGALGGGTPREGVQRDARQGEIECKMMKERGRAYGRSQKKCGARREGRRGKGGYGALKEWGKAWCQCPPLTMRAARRRRKELKRGNRAHMIADETSRGSAASWRRGEDNKDDRRDMRRGGGGGFDGDSRTDRDRFGDGYRRGDHNYRRNDDRDRWGDDKDRRGDDRDHQYDKIRRGGSSRRMERTTDDEPAGSRPLLARTAWEGPSENPCGDPTTTKMRNAKTSRREVARLPLREKFVREPAAPRQEEEDGWIQVSRRRR